MTVCKDSQGAFRLGRREFRFRSHPMQSGFANIELQLKVLFLHPTNAFRTRVAAALVFRRYSKVRGIVTTDDSQILTLGVARVFVLVLLLAAVAFCVMRLGLAGTTTVFALLDRTTLGVDMM